MDCPFCAEDLKDNASVCKHCGRDLLNIRPLIDLNQQLAKRVAELEGRITSIATQLEHHTGYRREGESVSLPSMSPAGAIFLAVLTIFFTRMFVDEATNWRQEALPPEIVVAIITLTKRVPC
jgi:hypothetical protein